MKPFKQIIKNLLFPVYTHWLETGLSAEEIEARLLHEVTEHRAFTAWDKVRSFSGWVRDGRFSLRSIYGSRKNPIVQIDGQIVDGTKLRLDCHMRKRDQIATLVILGVGVCMAPLVGIGMRSVPAGLAFLAISVSLGLSGNATLSAEARREIHKIEEILK